MYIVWTRVSHHFKKWLKTQAEPVLARPKLDQPRFGALPRPVLPQADTKLNQKRLNATYIYPKLTQGGANVLPKTMGAVDTSSMFLGHPTKKHFSANANFIHDPHAFMIQYGPVDVYR